MFSTNVGTGYSVFISTFIIYIDNNISVFI